MSRKRGRAYWLGYVKSGAVGAAGIYALLMAFILFRSAVDGRWEITAKGSVYAAILILALALIVPLVFLGLARSGAWIADRFRTPPHRRRD